MRSIVDLIGVVICLYVAMRCVFCLVTIGKDSMAAMLVLMLPALAVILVALGAAYTLADDLILHESSAITLP